MELSKPSKLLIRMIYVAALVIITAGIIYYRSFASVPFALGVIITSILNVIKVRMLERTVQRVTDMDVGEQETGKNVVRFQYLLRYLITGIVLVAVGFIQNYTTEPAPHSSRTIYIAVWAALFPQGPESLLNAPFISIWGALAGIFSLQLSVILVRSLKLEKDGVNFIKYEDDTDNDNGTNSKKHDVESNDEKDEENDDESDVGY